MLTERRERVYGTLTERRARILGTLTERRARIFGGIDPIWVVLYGMSMSAVTMYQGLEQIFRTIGGLRGVMLGEPGGHMDLPCIYTAYQGFDRPLRNSPPARNLTGMTHQFACRLVIQWVDNAQAEMQLLTLLDAIPDAIDLDPHLSGRLSSGAAWCASALTGFASISNVLYRVVDYSVTVIEKRQAT